MCCSCALRTLLVVAVTVLTVGVVAADAGVVVIGHPQLPTSELSVGQAKDFFLGKSKSFADGSQVKVVDQEQGNPIRDEFYQKLVGKTDAQLKVYWAKLVFTGKGVPPPSLANDSVIRNWVAETPGGIGCINESAVDNSVKVLLKP